MTMMSESTAEREPETTGIDAILVALGINLIIPDAPCRRPVAPLQLRAALHTRLTVRFACLLLPLGVVALTATEPQKPDKDQPNDKRPRLSLKAQPAIAMSPARVVLTAELQGGPNDYEDFYCPTVEWDWGDGTQSENTIDCAPYESGKSEIKRRFTVEHVFRAGVYRVTFKLKRRDKVVGLSTVNIQVRPGLRDIGQ
jgi:hypothetical protein